MYDGSRIKVGAGTLYVAPLGTTEPTSVTGAWPSAWKALGYTDAGSDFTVTPQTAEITVEEEYWAIRTVITGYSAVTTFALAEQTAQNLVVSLNGGIANVSAAVQGTNPDGSIWVEMPDVGTEVRVMLGWDAFPKAGIVGDAFGRLLMRQCLQGGAMKVVRRKGNNKATYACSFHLEKPATTMPFRFIFPATLAA